jgi:hypothetical protein
MGNYISQGDSESEEEEELESDGLQEEMDPLKSM